MTFKADGFSELFFGWPDRIRKSESARGLDEGGSASLAKESPLKIKRTLGSLLKIKDSQLHPSSSMSYIARFLLLIAIIGSFGVGPAYGADAFLGNLYNDSTLSFGRPTPVQSLPGDKIRLFVWNIHKAADQRLPQDFSDLSFGADLALFQEFVSTPSFIKNLVAANTEFEWTMAKSFQMFDFNFTGVATAYRVKPLGEEVIVSKVTEPITETPKTILLSVFSINGTYDTLLVANIHGINFVGLETYKVQIRQLVEKLRQHQGPMIVAGDFNTWDPARIAFLQKVFTPLGLSKVHTPVAGMLDLDHIFLRGLKANFVFDLSHIDSSDHAPLMADLLFENNKAMAYEDN
jgi:endonuclease/exonuclease/phosphatase (EEP) superfamily protein YafD